MHETRHLLEMINYDANVRVLFFLDWKSLQNYRQVNKQMAIEGAHEIKRRFKPANLRLHASDTLSGIFTSSGIVILSRDKRLHKNIKMLLEGDEGDYCLLQDGHLHCENGDTLDDILEIYGQYGSFFVRKNNRQIYVFGCNSYGQLAVARKIGRIAANDLKENHELSSMNIKEFLCGIKHGIGLTEERLVYAWGSDKCGQLGGAKNATKTFYLPGMIPNLENIVQISTGHYHNVALNDKGEVFTWGLNNDGQCGFSEDRKIIFSPTRIEEIEKVQSVAAGGHHTLILQTNGELLVCGKAEQGQCGIIGIPPKIYKPTKLLDKVTKIAAGFSHNLALRKGKVYAWGYNINKECWGESRDVKQRRHCVFSPLLVEIPYLEKMKWIAEIGVSEAYRSHILKNLLSRLNNILVKKKSLYEMIHASPNFASRTLRNPYREVDDILWRARFLLRKLGKEDMRLRFIPKLYVEEVQRLDVRCRELLNPYLKKKA